MIKPVLFRFEKAGSQVYVLAGDIQWFAPHGAASRTKIGLKGGYEVTVDETHVHICELWNQFFGDSYQVPPMWKAAAASADVVTNAPTTDQQDAPASPVASLKAVSGTQGAE